MSASVSAFKANTSIKSHPQYSSKNEDLLCGIFVVAYELGLSGKSNGNPFSEHGEIEQFTFQCGYEVGCGKINLPNIDDIKWLDILHLRERFSALISDRCRIVRPNPECLLFIGDAGMIRGVEEMFRLYYEDDSPHFLTVQMPTTVTPYATATLTFNKID